MESEQTTTQTSELPTTPTATISSEQKAIAVFGYFFPPLAAILFFQEEYRASVYSRFHANQQLVIAGIYFIIFFFMNALVMMFMFGLGYMLANLVMLAYGALVIYGAYYAYQGEQKPLPFLPQIEFIKKK